MAKEMNEKQSKIAINELPQKNQEIDKEKETEAMFTPYLLEIESNIESLASNLKVKTEAKERVENYLQENHHLYENIKNKAFELQKKLLDYNCKKEEITENPDFIFFDFENNICYSNHSSEMPICYVEDDNELHICKNSGIYIEKVEYTCAKLFLTNKKQIDKEIEYISAFDKILNYSVSMIAGQSKYSCFCMMPESIDAFNTRIRRCLNTAKGRIISIPKSVAVTYCNLKDLSINTRFCVVDLDGLHPVVTQLSIGKTENGEKIILREGFIKEKTIKYDYLSFAKEYLKLYENKYSVFFSDDEKDILIKNKKIQFVLTTKIPFELFNKTGKTDIIFDESIFKQCLLKFSTKDCSFKNCSRIYVISSIPNLVSGKSIIQLDNSSAFYGLTLIREKLLADENAIIWKERLPRVSLEVIDDKIGRFKTINLINENNEGQNIRLSIDEEIELPFTGTITLQKRKKEYYLPLEREIYSEDINSEKEAHFTNKSFPLEKDVSVDLVVKYNYMSESPIKLYARPKSPNSEFKEISNTWVDPHIIDVYSGPIYKGHSKNITPLKNADTFDKVTKKINDFINGKTHFESCNFSLDIIGSQYHKDYECLVFNYKKLRTLFDPSNINDKKFGSLYTNYHISDFYKAYYLLLNNRDKYAYEKSDIEKYVSGLNKIVSDIIVASSYFKPKDPYIKFLYQYLAKRGSDNQNVELLAKLSRCILTSEDDIYNVYDALSLALYNEILEAKKKRKSFTDKGNQLIGCVRTLSSNCWFNKNWIFNFYYSIKGKECVSEIIDFTHNFLQSNNFGQSKKFRDIMEFLVCISRLKDIDSNILNPNSPKTKEMLHALKSKYQMILKKLGDEKLVSRLSINDDQGQLFGYKNYIYMLIMTLSGEGQVDLVGYHDD